MAQPLPDADSSNLHLAHPHPGEYHALFASTASEWKGALSEAQYIEQCTELVSLDTIQPHPNLVHLDWILVDSSLPLASRQILSSCETFRKRVLIGRPGKGVEETVIFGIASVFTAPEFRRKGYARRMLQLLAAQYKECIGTILFSDIGKQFYSELGWKVLEGNRHVDFPVTNKSFPVGMVGRGVKELMEEDLEGLCKEDEETLRRNMERGGRGKVKVVVVPDLKHMAWHHMREEFVCRRLFGKAPMVKGAMSGEPGKRVWIVWARKYDVKPDGTEAGNILYVLRLAIEGLGTDGKVQGGRREELKEHLRAVIERAGMEAKEWKLSGVRLWGPSPLVRELVKEMGVSSWETEREQEGIASLRLNEEDEVEWLANERYEWC